MLFLNLSGEILRSILISVLPSVFMFQKYCCSTKLHAEATPKIKCISGNKYVKLAFAICNLEILLFLYIKYDDEI